MRSAYYEFLTNLTNLYIDERKKEILHPTRHQTSIDEFVSSHWPAITEIYLESFGLSIDPNHYQFHQREIACAIRRDLRYNLLLLFFYATVAIAIALLM